jgi:diaminohydroxyphosphoribosylaminopyrimidine deaminase/5-amino-6-(5-phosphoribosylamino)uracil reductase
MPQRVVVCNTDPNPLVAGKGIKKLEEMGIDVTIGTYTQLGRELNKRFFTFHEKQRPYIVLKWAQTKDGFIARKNYESKWISNEESRKLVHTWRSEEEGILVGKTTAKMDNPQLNVRMVEGKDPVRIIIDRNLELPRTYNIFDNSQTTIIYNQEVEEANEYTQFVRLDFSQNIIPQILEDLYRRKILSVLVEGGSQTITSFMDIGMWDEARVFTSPNTFGEGIKAPMIFSAMHESLPIGEDELTIYFNS